MVFVNQGLPSGPLTDEKLDRLSFTRIALVGIWVCAFMRLVFDNPLNGIATGFAAITGTYTFMNDKRFTGCYDFMFANCMACGSGGTQCMGPYISICLINAVFDVFRMYSLVDAGAALEVPITTLSVVLSIIFQGYSFYTCVMVYKELVQGIDLDSPLTQPFSQGYVTLVGEPSQQRMGGFVPFGGQGRRLG